jgi:uncharacterized protein YceK
MKQLILALALLGLLAGCASHESSNRDNQYNNNATQGTGASTATNSAGTNPNMP